MAATSVDAETSPVIHHPDCPLCGVRATMWEPRTLAGVLLVRYRCWTGHDWSATVVLGQ